MITNKILDEWEDKLAPAITATFSPDDSLELIRLSRLGLWAERADAKAKLDRAEALLKECLMALEESIECFDGGPSTDLAYEARDKIEAFFFKAKADPELTRISESYFSNEEKG